MTDDATKGRVKPKVKHDAQTPPSRWGLSIGSHGSGSGSLSRRQRRAAFLFIAPGLILFALFVAYPVVATIHSSFFSIRPQGRTTETAFVGLDWFRKALFDDKTFRTGMRNSFLWATWSVLIDIPLAFALAYALYKRVRGWHAYRTIWFAPLLLSPVLVGLMWRSVLRYDGGLLNGLLSLLGLGAWTQDWLGQPTALFWLFLMTTWSTAGFYMVLILAALEDMPKSLLEAAEIDGASEWQRIRHVVLPLLRPVLVTLAILTFVFKMRVFDLVFVTTKGGPYGTTETVVTWIVKRAFFWQGAFDLGYPAAMSTIWLIVMAVGVVVLRKVLGGDEEETEY